MKKVDDVAEPQQKKPQMTSEQKLRLRNALSDIYRFRDSISQCLAEIADAPAELIEHCQLNDWNDEVAFTLRDAGFKLGVVLATLDRWARDAEIPQDVIDWVEEANKRRED